MIIESCLCLWKAARLAKQTIQAEIYLLQGELRLGIGVNMDFNST